MEDILKSLPLSDDIVTALLSYKGILGDTLQCVLAYERGDWDRVHCAALDSATITEAYLQAIAWTSEASKSLAV